MSDDEEDDDDAIEVTAEEPTPEDWALLRLATIASIIGAMEQQSLSPERTANGAAYEMWCSAFNRSPELTIAGTVILLGEMVQAVAIATNTSVPDFIMHLRQQAAKTVR